MVKKRILVTAALPYTNNVAHIGTIVGSHYPADIFARYCRLRGYDIIFIGGTDENGAPSEVAALELGITPKELCDRLYEVHKKIYDWFLISYDNFSRTSLPIHHQTTQEFFKKIYELGFVSEDVMKCPYCTNCKIFLPDRYVEGTCPYCNYQQARGDQCENCTKLLDPHELINPRCKICGGKPEIRETKHLFLELGKLQHKLERWIKSNWHWREFVRSWSLGWIKEGLKKRCITRDLKWGVKVPLKDYENKIFYCWFDAPLGYISSTKELAEKIKKPKAWKNYWQKDCFIYNFIGKDNIIFHTIFFPAMLIAHGEFKLPYNVVGLHFCNYEGEKISKSKSWGIFCEKIIESNVKPDVWRYYFTYLIPETKDTEFKWKEFEERINGELVANIGNFIYRTLSFVWKYFDGAVKKRELKRTDKQLLRRIDGSIKRLEKLMEEVRLREALFEILKISSEGNKYFQKNSPWELVKRNKERCQTVLWVCLNLCKRLAILLHPYLPESSQKIFKQLNLQEDFKWKNLKVEIKSGHKINEPKILFEKLTPEKIEELKAIVTRVTPLKEFFNLKQKNNMEVSFKDFQKLDLKVGKVISAEPIEGSENLIKLMVDFGTEKRQSIAGLAKWYKPEDLIGKKYVFILNLERKKFFGLESECMIFAAEDKKGNIVLIAPERNIEIGSKVH
ncbi:MAG: methionine--tRNA ligase [Candidatus Aenigmarchaeota archaeon]|nr:methionine--tRNA ligase [Candidatus Aenigmarchaeota archaeon]